MSPRAALVGWAKNNDPARDAATQASAATLAAWVAMSRENGDGGRKRGSGVADISAPNVAPGGPPGVPGSIAP